MLHRLIQENKIDSFSQQLQDPKNQNVVNSKDINGNTPLIVACQDDKVEFVRSLLDNSVININAEDNYGNTALVWASMRGFTDCMLALLEKHCDINHRDKNGMTALMVACNYGELDAVQLLIQHGADCDIADNDGRTALNHCESEDIQFVLQNSSKK